MLKFILSCLLSSSLMAKETGCPPIDPNVKDPDGMPLCPDVVKENSAWAVYRCAVDQAQTFHRPTQVEMDTMGALLDGYHTADVGKMMSSADKLHLQVCRVHNKPDDTFLLFYTKPGVKDYSGPLLTLREGHKSKVLFIGPHDDTDGTSVPTKLAVANSLAMGTISNGHKRSTVRKNGSKGTVDDFSHCGSYKNNLGAFAVKKLCDLYPSSVVLHVHGMKEPSEVLRRARNLTIQSAYETSIKDHTNIKVFKPLNADFSVDALVNTNWYVKTEIPARIHNVNRNLLGNIAKDFEKNDWAWTTTPDAPQPPVDPEPPVDPVPPEPEPPVTDIPYKYAPVPKGLLGEKDLACVAVNYTDPLNNFMTADRCQKVAQNVTDFYDRNSRGKFHLVPKGYHMDYQGGAWASWEKAELVAKQKFDADYYIIPNLFRKGGNHASNQIAHVIQLTGWVVNHEVGHLLGINHTGAYTYPVGKAPEYHQYADQDSVMGGGGTGSKFLTAPQYYAKAWLPKVEMALYDEDVTYTLKKVSDFKGKDALTGVMLPRKQIKDGKGNRDAFVAWPLSCNGCAALYLSTVKGGESALVAKFKDEYYDDNFTGLHIKVTKYDSVKKRMELTMDFAPKPKEFTPNLVALTAEDVATNTDFCATCQGDSSSDQPAEQL